MIGVLLLFIAIYTFFQEKYRYISYFLYLSFMIGYGGGLGLWTDHIAGVKNVDCAVVYTIVINVYYVCTKQWSLPKFIFVKFYLIFIGFLLASAIFSLLYYHLSPVQIVQGGRHFLLLFSLPILYKCSKQEFSKILELLFYVCVVTCILYIPQIFIGESILPYEGESEVDESTGLYRFYNYPHTLDVFLCLCFFSISFYKCENTIPVRVLFMLTLVSTQGRMYIIITLITLFLFILLTAKREVLKKQLTIMLVVALPLLAFISSRFSEGGTETDLETLLEGGFDEDYQSESSSTMTYRLAWAFERGYYLTERPIGEQIFGLGMCSESQEWVNNKYDFMIGLSDENDQIAQLKTPDIAYGNMITQMGFGGSVLYIIFVISLAVFFWKNKNNNPWMAFYAISVPLVFFLGFAASTFSEPQYFAMPFLMTCLVNEEETSKDEKKKKLKALLLLLLKKKRREMQMTVQS